jgi:hypothetical protein
MQLAAPRRSRLPGECSSKRSISSVVPANWPRAVSRCTFGITGRQSQPHPDCRKHRIPARQRLERQVDTSKIGDLGGGIHTSSFDRRTTRSCQLVGSAGGNPTTKASAANASVPRLRRRAVASPIGEPGLRWLSAGGFCGPRLDTPAPAAISTKTATVTLRLSGHTRRCCHYLRGDVQVSAVDSSQV